jgi:hypothetical protein
MPTYTLISSQVLGSSTQLVTFSSIPQTYKDLVLKFSARTDRASEGDALVIAFNSLSAVYSGTGMANLNNGQNSWQATTTNAYNYIFCDYLLTASTATTNTFGSAEVYLPNYTSTANKPVSVFAATENNGSFQELGVVAGLYQAGAAISTVKVYSQTGANFIAGSSFYLYGI